MTTRQIKDHRVSAAAAAPPGPPARGASVARVRPPARLATLALAVALAGCGGESGAPAGPEHRTETSTENGVVTVTNTDGPQFAGPLFSLEPVVTLPGDETDAEATLYRPSGVTIGDDGNFYVIDAGNSRVAVFDAEGNFVRAFGRPGQGPGEFSNMLVLQSIDNDVLNVHDLRGQRASYIRTDGTLIDSLTHAGNPVQYLARGPAGQIITVGLGLDPDDPRGALSRRVTLRSEDGRETLADFSTALVQYRVARIIEGPGGSNMTTATAIVYAGEPAAVPVPDRGFMLTDGDEAELKWYDYSGALKEVVRLGLPRRPVSDEMRQRYEERERRRQIEAAQLAGRDAPRLADIAFAESVGFWNWAIVDDKGYVWLRDVARQYERAGDQGWLFHLVAPDGTYVGIVESPISRPSVRNGLLMGYLADPATGDMKVEVFRLRPLPEGFSY